MDDTMGVSTIGFNGVTSGPYKQLDDICRHRNVRVTDHGVVGACPVENGLALITAHGCGNVAIVLQQEHIMAVMSIDSAVCCRLRLWRSTSHVTVVVLSSPRRHESSARLPSVGMCDRRYHERSRPHRVATPSQLARCWRI